VRASVLRRVPRASSRAGPQWALACAHVCVPQCTHACASTCTHSARKTAPGVKEGIHALAKQRTPSGDRESESRADVAESSSAAPSSSSSKTLPSKTTVPCASDGTTRLHACTRVRTHDGAQACAQSRRPKPAHSRTRTRVGRRFVPVGVPRDSTRPCVNEPFASPRAVSRAGGLARAPRPSVAPDA
jgi:hypothetical protein